jgi:hypothetical protein
MLYWTLGIFGSLIGVWAGYTHLYESGLEEPEYRIVDQLGNVEIRQYESFIIASTKPSLAGKNGLGEGFRTLAGYIFGGNQPNEKMSMTAPVLQQNNSGETISMTAPVVTTSQNMTMAFVMPSGRTLDDLPKPSTPDVSLQEVNWGLMAVIRFSGRGKQDRFKAAEKNLLEEIKRSGRSTRGPALYAQYNSPYAFPLLRRNEVIVPINND